MNAIIRRIQSGKRWWAAEAVLRGFGLAMLATCAFATIWLYRSVHRPPLHEPRATEFIASIGVVHGWCLGWPFLLEGPGLFRLVSVTRRGSLSL